MPPKRKAGRIAAVAKKQAKATENNEEIENGSSTEEEITSKKGREVDAPKQKGRPKRGGGGSAPVYTEEPLEKVSKIERKRKGQPGKQAKPTKKKEEVEEDNEDEEGTGNEPEEPPEKNSKTDKNSKEKPEKKARATKKKKVKEDSDHEDDDEGNEPEEPTEKNKKSGKNLKEKPEKKARATKKKEEVKEDSDHEDDDDEEGTSKNKKKTDKKSKSEKKEKPTKETKKIKQDKEKDKKAPAKPAKKVKNKDEVEENGIDEEESNEKGDKTPLNPTATKWDNIDFKCTKVNANGEKFNLKISCWNIGGLKSWVKKDCMKFLEFENPDILCLQETKCNEGKLPDEIKEIADYKQYWCSSDKEGYAGVGLLSKEEPVDVSYGINDADQDIDGRCITAEYDGYYVVCVYVPNAGRKLNTLPKRLEWNEAFKAYIKELDEKKPVIICGDMNVSHTEIDLARPKSNTKNAGFTQEERDGMTDFLGEGFVDTFRDLYPDKTDMYTFWSYMSNARSKNIGWRLDYFILSERIKDNVCDNVIRSEILGSDHCPITLFINL